MEEEIPEEKIEKTDSELPKKKPAAKKSPSKKTTKKKKEEGET
jgi:hypothetical protein